jgi:hypothetical protein
MKYYFEFLMVDNSKNIIKGAKSQTYDLILQDNQHKFSTVSIVVAVLVITGSLIAILWSFYRCYTKMEAQKDV